MDSFAAGTLGVLTTGRSLLDSLRKFADCLDFIQKQVCRARFLLGFSCTRCASLVLVLSSLLHALWLLQVVSIVQTGSMRPRAHNEHADASVKEFRDAHTCECTHGCAYPVSDEHTNTLFPMLPRALTQMVARLLLRTV
eukprot:232334-Pleurochrysis_carterae.AAC.1